MSTLVFLMYKMGKNLGTRLHIKFREWRRAEEGKGGGKRAGSGSKTKLNSIMGIGQARDG